MKLSVNGGHYLVFEIALDFSLNCPGIFSDSNMVFAGGKAFLDLGRVHRLTDFEILPPYSVRDIRL